MKVVKVVKVARALSLVTVNPTRIRIKALVVIQAVRKLSLKVVAVNIH